MSQPWRGQIASKLASGSRVKITGQFSRWRRSNHSLWSGGSWTAWNNPPQTHSICQKRAKPGSKANGWFFSRSCGWRRGSVNKKPCDRAATPSPPGHRLHWVKVVLLLSAEEKVLPLKAAECAEAPISLRMFTIAGWTACRAVRGKREDERRRRYTAGKKGKRGRRCEDEECEAATSGGNTEEKHGSQLRHRLFNCPACQLSSRLHLFLSHTWC